MLCRSLRVWALLTLSVCLEPTAGALLVRKSSEMGGSSWWWSSDDSTVTPPAAAGKQDHSTVARQPLHTASAIELATKESTNSSTVVDTDRTHRVEGLMDITQDLTASKAKDDVSLKKLETQIVELVRERDALKHDEARKSRELAFLHTEIRRARGTAHESAGQAVGVARANTEDTAQASTASAAASTATASTATEAEADAAIASAEQVVAQDSAATAGKADASAGVSTAGASSASTGSNSEAVQAVSAQTVASKAKTEADMEAEAEARMRAEAEAAARKKLAEEKKENPRPSLQPEQFAVPVPGALGSCSDFPTPSSPSSPKRSSSNSPQKDEEAEVRRRALEWRRLLSERETTARELGNVLQRVEDLEEALEDRRIELQAAEKRRERERRSLLTALREHDWNGGFEEEESNVRDTEAVQSPTAQTLSPEATTSAWYLQRISELEDQVDMFRKKLEDVQAREAVLNEHAVVRMKALRYAASAHGRSVDAVLAAIDNEQPGEARQRRRGDLGGLAELLEDLFVENFALRGQALIRMSGIGSARTSRRPSMFSSQVSDTAEVSGAGTADSLDLSGFVRNPDDAASDDSVEESDGIVAFGAGAHAAATSSGIEAEPAAEAPPLTPRNSEYWPDSPRSLPSPRLHMLSAEVAGLSFNDISIAE